MTTREAKFVEAKLKGKSNSQAALEAVPNLKPTSVGNVGMRLSRSVEVQTVLQNALLKHNITIDRVAQTISEGMSATKTVIIGKAEDAFADQVPDTANRLKAADMASGLLGLKGAKQEPPKPDDTNPHTAKELAAALEHSDEIKLNQIIFNKKEDS